MSNPERTSGSRPLASMRRETLLRAVEQRGHIGVAEMATALNVSEMTIRRDLDQLAEAGLINRDHGGATAVTMKAPLDRDEPAFEVRGRSHMEAKARIAQTAAMLVAPGQTIGLDTGSTTHRLAEELLPISGLRIFSSNLRTADLLTIGASPVYLLGGSVRPGELSVCGPVASAQLRSLWLDMVFIGISGLMEQGLFDYSLEDGEMKRVLMERAAHVVVICDSSKFGRRSLTQVAPLSAVNTLVVDALPTGPIVKALTQVGVRILVAGDAMASPSDHDLRRDSA